MKLKSVIFSALAAIAMLAGCQKENDNLGGMPTIVISETEMAFGVESGEKTLTVKANRDWKVEYEADWIEVSPKSGKASATPQTVTVTVLANDGAGAYDRSEDVKFTIGMDDEYLTVTQTGAAGSAEALIVYSNDFDITKAQNNSGWPYLDSNYDIWDNKKGSGAESVTYAFGGKMSVRTSESFQMMLLVSLIMRDQETIRCSLEPQLRFSRCRISH